MEVSENKMSVAADVRSSQKLGENCVSTACASFPCPPPLVCFDLWRYAECRYVFCLISVASIQAVNSCTSQPKYIDDPRSMQINSTFSCKVIRASMPRKLDGILAYCHVFLPACAAHAFSAGIDCWHCGTVAPIAEWSKALIQDCNWLGGVNLLYSYPFPLTTGQKKRFRQYCVISDN